MPNHRQICPYCKTDVLNSIIGSHILRKHGVELFADKQNLKALHSDMNFRKPMLLHVTAEDSFYFCMADSSCIKKEPLADKHFKGRADAHREAIIALREKYPREGPKVDADQTVDAPIVSAPSGLVISDTEKKSLQKLIMEITHSELGLSSNVKSVFKRMGLVMEEEDLRDLFPTHPYWEKTDEYEAYIQERIQERAKEEEEALSKQNEIPVEPIVEQVVPEQPIVEEPVYVPPPPPAPIPEPIQEAPVLPTPQPVTKSGPRLPNMTVEQTEKFMEFFPPESKEFQTIFKSVNSGKFVGPPAEVAALMYKSASLQRQPETTFGNLIQNTKLKKAQRVQKPLETT